MSYSEVSLCCCVLLLSYVTTCTAAPITALQVRLLSQYSDQFVQINEDGSITANGTVDTAAVFYARTQGNLISLELNDGSGKFLMLNEVVENNTNSTGDQQYPSSPSRYELVVGIPSNVSHIQWETAPDGTYALKQTLDSSTNCFIAFNEDGSVAGPCNLSQDDPVTRTLVTSLF